MDQLIQTFHIDVYALLAQMVNFTILLLILYKFAYGPILETLNARSRKIEKGLKDSEVATRKLEEISQKEKEILKKAKEEAKKIVEKGEKSAVENAQTILVQAKNQADKISRDAQKQIEQEKNKVLREVKEHIGDLVVAATGKIIGTKLDPEKDKELIEKSLKE